MKTVLAFTLILLSALPAHAGASDWFLTDGARMRLISAPSGDGQTINAGLEFELGDGWKTYWRSPGGSGLPPQVHFLGSRNTASVVMRLPVPEELNDATGNAIGYKKHVVFPITVRPKIPGQKIVLKAGGVVGICGEICVPVQFNLSLTEEGAGSGSRMDIASALLKAKSDLPTAPTDNQKVLSIKPLGNIPASLSIKAKVPANATSLSLFVEGPPEWYLTTATLTDRDQSNATFKLILHDAPESAQLADTELRLTLVADGKGTDQTLAISKP